MMEHIVQSSKTPILPAPSLPNCNILNMCDLCYSYQTVCRLLSAKSIFHFGVHSLLYLLLDLEKMYGVMDPSLLYLTQVLAP